MPIFEDVHETTLEEWVKSHTEAKNGKVVSQTRSEQITQALDNLGYGFRYNEVAQRVEVNGRRLDDEVAAEIRVQMRDLGFGSRQAVDDVCMVLARRASYHPIRDYFNSLTWDGQNHIAKLSRCFKCDNDPVAFANGQHRSLIYVYLYRWLIGAVAKVEQQAQNMMFVLAGTQGIGKSHFAWWLCSPLPQYFVSQAVNPDDKDSAFRLTDHFIWEVDELDATVRRADVAALKAFITKHTVVGRRSYARHDTEAPAIASLIGTVNLGAGFLADVTGNRRFYVATISAIDWAYTTIDIHQLWAQAVAEYRRGAPWMLQASERQAQRNANEAHELPSLLDDWLETDFEHTDDESSGLTAAEMVSHLDARGHTLRGTSRQQAMELATALVKRGIRKRKIGNQWTYLGVLKRGNND